MKIKYIRKFKTVLIIIVVILIQLINQNNCEIIKWYGGSSFDDPNNWSTGRVPSTNDMVIIDGTNYVKGSQRPNLLLSSGKNIEVFAVSMQFVTFRISYGSLNVRKLYSEYNSITMGKPITRSSTCTYINYRFVDFSKESYNFNAETSTTTSTQNNYYNDERERIATENRTTILKVCIPTGVVCGLVLICACVYKFKKNRSRRYPKSNQETNNIPMTATMNIQIPNDDISNIKTTTKQSPNPQPALDNNVTFVDETIV